MERDDPAYAGQREYTALLLKIDDPLILGFSHAGPVAVPDESPGSLRFESRGTKHLKGLPTPLEVFALVD
jgi:hypothetical protein